MINKIYKRIHNKYSNLFKFLFSIKYVFIIFIISACLFVTIPKFFNYDKKYEIINNYLIKNHGLEMLNYNKIAFHIFPQPNLSFSQAALKVKNKNIEFKSKNINFFLNYKNIYNYDDLEINKIVLHGGKALINTNTSKNLINFLFKFKNKLSIKNFNIVLNKKDTSLITLKNISFANYGYKKNHINGEVFGQKFKILFTENQNLKFKLIDTGIKADINFSNKKLNENINGSSKISLLDNLLKFDFNIDKNKIKIINSNFRNKNLSFSLDSVIKFNPFFRTFSNININFFNENIIDNLNLQKILINKKLIKKLNSKININYKNKKYFNKIINNFSVDLNLAYGRINYSDKINFLGGYSSCKVNGNLIDEYPRLDFICLLDIQDQKKILKKFSINKKINNNIIQLDIEGHLNLLNKKMHLKNISNNKNYIANKEDLKYFEEKFESNLFNESFFKIFKIKKVKYFLLEII